MTAAVLNKGGRPRSAPPPNAYDKAVGARIKMQMEMCRMHPGHLAHRIGKNDSQVYRYLSGDSAVSPDVLTRIADALGCRADVFTKDIKVKQ